MPPCPAGQNFCPDPLSLPLALSPRPCPGLLSLLSFTTPLRQCALPLRHLMFKMCCGGPLLSSSSSVLGLVLPPCVFLQTISVVAWGFLIQKWLGFKSPLVWRLFGQKTSFTKPRFQSPNATSLHSCTFTLPLQRLLSIFMQL